MHVSSKDEAPSLSRGDGLVSTILHSKGDAAEDDSHSDQNAHTDLTITWVEVEPGASQVRHSHEPEQVYVVAAGEGRMFVGDEQRDVEAGDLIHIPSNADHAIENTGDQTLEYVSAATPAFPSEDVEKFYEA